MATLDITVGGASANSYASLAESNTYLDLRSVAQTALWTALSDAEKTDALVRATQVLDQIVDWHGKRVEFATDVTTSQQALRWPRTGVYNPDGYAVTETGIPDFVKNAQIELAFRIGTDITSLPTDEVSISDIRLMRIESIELHFNKSAQFSGSSILPPEVIRIISPYSYIGTGFSGRTIRA